MTKTNKVIWTEGLFLQPQHFQQQERHFEFELHCQQSTYESYFWGFTALELDIDLLKSGKVGIHHAEGFFQDGTFFSIPDQTPAPAPISLPKTSTEQRIYLCLPAQASNAVLLEREEKVNTVKFQTESVRVHDCYEAGSEPELIDTAVPNLSLRFESENREGLHVLPIGLAKKLGELELQLESRFIAPCLNAKRAKPIDQMLKQVISALENKAEQLGQRAFRKGNQSRSEIGDFIFLQTCLRHRPALLHQQSLRVLHPERLFESLSMLLGDLQLFDESRSLSTPMTYQHDAPRVCFEAVVNPILEILSGVHDQQAIQIQLTEKQYGLHLGVIQDQRLLKNASFILAVYCEAPNELLKKQLPVTLKIGPSSKIRDLVNLNLPGIPLQVLSQAPRALPYYGEHTYFQLETKGQSLWAELNSAPALALHYAGNLQGIRFELWAIRHDAEALVS